MPTETFLVLGSASFSGATFVANALAAGADVVGIGRSPEPDDALLPYKWAPHDRFTFHALDLNRDLEQIEAVIREFRPAYIVNFAAQGMVAQSWEQPDHWYQTNVVATARLVDRLWRLDFVRRFVQASTPEVYGSTSGMICETQSFNPSTPYAVSKAACDMNMLAYHRARGFPVTFTRAANVCGPGQQLYRIIPRTILSILTGRKLRLEGGGTSRRSFIHIDDVAAGTLAAARRGEPGAAYHLATDRMHTIREVVEEICRQMGVAIADVVEQTPARLGENTAYEMNCRKARDELDWEPRWTLPQTLADTIEWARRNLDRLRTLPVEYVHRA
ncbi:MAG: NAD-dependent epimerase/dehydratase family protein [Planctomycetaceae bacterium]